MMRFQLGVILSMLTVGAVCAADVPGLSDQHESEETKALSVNRKALSGKRLLFGHQQASYRGMNRGGQWFNNRAPFANRSDCKDIVGSHPAVHGFNMNLFSRDGGNPTHNAGVHVQAAYKRGGGHLLRECCKTLLS
jgi:hypothetical protein